MAINHLLREKSPYLLQHLHNPVDWYPWGPDAFEKARTEEKCIFLSIGYSTCHWCHVMAHETFEDPAIAQILNDRFVCVKVDREERPDVDRVYMTFVQATTGSGGWPMTVWLTPELKPFFGGTYFPPRDLAATAKRVAEVWATERAGIRASAHELLEDLRTAVQLTRKVQDTFGPGVREQAFQQLASSFDPAFGGFGSAPKFPRPATFHFLCHYYAARPDSEEGRRALEMTTVTLQKMAEGGIHDHLGGGFHRYAVDRCWQVPHFEKMLYDQAQIAMACLATFHLTRDALFAEIARDSLDYVQREMTDPTGGFHSAEDADSLIAHDAHDPAEGAFYVWTAAEIEALLGPEPAKIYNFRFGVEADGNVSTSNDPRQEFRGRNILMQRHTLAETAAFFGLSEASVASSLAKSRTLLFEARQGRPRPHRDDKIVTAWNGLMISAFARGARMLDDPRYQASATRAARSVHQHLYREADGLLLRSYRDGASTIAGFADDYAFLIQGLLDLYETTFDPFWVEWAAQLQTRQDDMFWDEQADGYFTTTDTDATILLRSKEIYDSAEPSPNSVAVCNLVRLSQMLGRADWRERAQKTLQAFGQHLGQHPSEMPQMLVGLEWLQAKPRQIVIAGKLDAPDTRAMLREVNRRPTPGQIVLLADGGEGQAFFARHLDVMKEIVPLNSQATAFLCEGSVCHPPTSDLATLARLLQG